MAEDPERDFMSSFLADEPDEPVVMLNLLRYADGGRTLYQQYAKAFAETVAERHGVEVVYAGDGLPALVAGPDQNWDSVILVRYPSRHAFARMLSDPAYQKISPLRARALAEAVLQPTRGWRTT